MRRGSKMNHLMKMTTDYKVDNVVVLAVLIVLSGLLLSAYLATGNYIPVITYLVIGYLMRCYTKNANMIVGVSLVSVYLMVRFNVFKQNFTGIGITDDYESISMVSNNKLVGSLYEGFEQQSDTNKKEVKKIDIESRPEGFQNTTEIEKTMSVLENAVDRLEGSFNKIISMGDKLGMGDKLREMGGNVDLDKLLNKGVIDKK